jgi:hypothetical protein
MAFDISGGKLDVKTEDSSSVPITGVAPGAFTAEPNAVHLEGTVKEHAFWCPITTQPGTVENTIESGAFSNSAPLLTVKDSPGVYVNGDGVKFSPYSFYVDRAIELNAPVTVNIPKEVLQPVADSLKEIIALVKEMKADAKATEDKMSCEGQKAISDFKMAFWIILGLGMAAGILAAGLYGHHRGLTHSAK